MKQDTNCLFFNQLQSNISILYSILFCMLKEAKQDIFQQILNNITTRINYEGEDYYLLVKSQEQGKHSLIFFTDFSANFWAKKVTFDSLIGFKEELKLKSDIKFFVEHFAYGLQQFCYVSQFNPHPILQIKFKVSNGLLLNCTIKLESHVNIEQKPEKFQTLLKIFGAQLFEAQQFRYKEVMMEASKKQITMLNPKNFTRQQQAKLTSQLFTKPEAKIIAEKNRDLIHPFRKKRTGKGMKIFVEQQSEDSEDQMSDEN